MTADGMARLNANQARIDGFALLRAADKADHERIRVRRRIGAKVHEVMTVRGVTVEHLATELLTSEGNLWRRLSGAADFSASDIVRIAEALGVRPGLLVD
ncbi:hypothetical protein BN12_220027 [Nostocoides japonicum T1-X7]|uniref:HTH cro/C1-type domain-containing protein n=1 Tax=Nostocoides japonicum T1-X7 TaxID=1194083 RepID=A0A077M0N5_9MICO|nr:helix-turn-helix transcriptional regulator [Tetrasphaera japonica]CCH77749.1 hypothetical protein BN12_220027 [Tetrasphaera japonica T1-X7]